MTAIQALKEKVTALAEKMGLTAEAVEIVNAPAAEATPAAPEAVAAEVAPAVEATPAVEGDVDHGAEVKGEEAPATEAVAAPAAEVDPVAELAEKFNELDAKFTEALANASTEMRAELEKEFDERVAKAAAQKLASATAQPLPVTPGEANDKGEISKPKLKGAAAVAAALKARRGA
jgi:hypothetical protein